MTIQRIYLVGFMGCGKSTLGKALAKSMSWTFVDMDHLFEQQHQTSISNYFLLHGEDSFRVAEQQVLAHASVMQKVIIGTGGGAPCFFNNMEVMNQTGLVIYLKLSPAILFERLVNAKQTRPLVAEKTDKELMTFIEDKLSEREPFYAKSRIVVDAGRLSVDDYINVIRSTEEFGAL